MDDWTGDQYTARVYRGPDDYEQAAPAARLYSPKYSEQGTNYESAFRAEQLQRVDMGPPRHLACRDGGTCGVPIPPRRPMRRRTIDDRMQEMMALPALPAVGAAVAGGAATLGNLNMTECLICMLFVFIVMVCVMCTRMISDLRAQVKALKAMIKNQ